MGVAEVQSRATYLKWDEAGYSSRGQSTPVWHPSFLPLLVLNRTKQGHVPFLNLYQGDS